MHFFSGSTRPEVKGLQTPNPRSHPAKINLKTKIYPELPRSSITTSPLQSKLESCKHSIHGNPKPLALRLSIKAPEATKMQSAYQERREALFRLPRSRVVPFYTGCSTGCSDLVLSDGFVAFSRCEAYREPPISGTRLQALGIVWRLL